jgi:hypothetical protein
VARSRGNRERPAAKRRPGSAPGSGARLTRKRGQAAGAGVAGADVAGAGAAQASRREAAAREAAFQALRADAASTWGPARAAAIETTLRRTADAIWQLSQLGLRSDDRPGFFLTDVGTEKPGEDTSP